ncbi:MAG: MMPL family transporter [Dehalococcoidia bacterium]
MFSTLAHVVARKRSAIAIIFVWVLLVAASRVAPQPKTSTQQQDLLPSQDDSIIAAHLANNPAKFPSAGAQQVPMVVIFRNENGLSPDDVAKARTISDYLNDPTRRPAELSALASVFTANAVAPGAPLPDDPRFLSSDRKTLTMTGFFTVAGREEGLAGPVKRVEQEVRQQAAADPNLKTGFSGFAVQGADSSQAFKNLNGTLTVISVILIMVLLLAIYRSPILPLIPLVSVGMAYAISAGLFSAIARAFNLTVNPQSTSLALVLILGAGTDYTLFIVSRFREELRQNESTYEAMWHTMANIGEAIASSALIVVVTLLTLVLASLKFFSNLGPSAALAIACMLVAGLTLVPAILVLFGRLAFWPFMPRYGEQHREDRGYWNRVAAIVAARPGTVLAISGLVFLGLAVASIGLHQRYDFVSNFPPNYASRQGQELLEKAGPTDVGKLSPTSVFVTSDDAILSHADRLAAVSDALARTTGVQSVSGFGGSPRLSADQIQQRDTGLPPSQRSIAADGKTARITVLLNRDPYITAAMDLIPGIRRTAKNAVRGTSLATNVGGDTALDADTRSAVNRDLVVLGPLVFLAIGIILAALLRSLVAPLYLLLSTLLSYFATLGLTTLIFQGPFHETGIQDFVPPFMAVFLIALGADYNVFIMSRIREEAQRVGLHEGTQRAIARTGGVITSAGIILAGTFAVLLVPPLQFLKELGFAVAAGVLLDTFVVRALLVPSMVFLLGRWNWWPSRVGRRAAAPALVGSPAAD